MLFLTILTILALVGMAAYCMVCERLADNQAHAGRATPPSPMTTAEPAFAVED
jgi:hypothetical protein